MVQGLRLSYSEVYLSERTHCLVGDIYKCLEVNLTKSRGISYFACYSNWEEAWALSFHWLLGTKRCSVGESDCSWRLTPSQWDSCSQPPRPHPVLPSAHTLPVPTLFPIPYCSLFSDQVFHFLLALLSSKGTFTGVTSESKCSLSSVGQTGRYHADHYLWFPAPFTTDLLLFD